MDPESTTEPAGPLRCARCTDSGGPFTFDGLCEDCERLVPGDGAA